MDLEIDERCLDALDKDEALGETVANVKHSRHEMYTRVAIVLTEIKNEVELFVSVE